MKTLTQTTTNKVMNAFHHVFVKGDADKVQQAIVFGILFVPAIVAYLVIGKVK